MASRDRRRNGHRAFIAFLPGDPVTEALWVAALDLALWLAIVEAARLVVT